MRCDGNEETLMLSDVDTVGLGTSFIRVVIATGFNPNLACRFQLGCLLRNLRRHG